MFTFSVLEISFQVFPKKSIWHLDVTWLICQYFTRIDLKPGAFLARNFKGVILVSLLLDLNKFDYCFHMREIGISSEQKLPWKGSSLVPIKILYQWRYSLSLKIQNIFERHHWYLSSRSSKAVTEFDVWYKTFSYSKL